MNAKNTLQLLAILGLAAHTTHAFAQTDAVAAPNLSIAGDVLTDIVRNGSVVSVEGIAEAGTEVASANIGVQDVSNFIAIDLNGVIGGSFTLDNTTATSLVLQMTVHDPTGNVSTVGTSNTLIVDNDGPEISITFPPSGAHFGVAPVTVIGTAVDVGAAGLDRVELNDGGTPELATGTEMWSWIWNPTSPGNFTLTAKAIDLLGNEAVADDNLDIGEPTHIVNPSFETDIPTEEDGEGFIIPAAPTGWATDLADPSFYNYTGTVDLWEWPTYLAASAGNNALAIYANSQGSPPYTGTFWQTTSHTIKRDAHYTEPPPIFRQKPG